MKLLHWMFVLALFTSSFDLFLVANVGGSVRFCQLMLLFVEVGALGIVIQRGTVLWPKGGSAMAFWFIAQCLFVPFSPAGFAGLYLHLLLTFELLGVYAVLQLYGHNTMRVESLMRLYLISFVTMGVFGLVQFLLPILGIPGPFVSQYYIPGRLARINGLSYEPSYYVTYLIMGCIMLIDLRMSGAQIVAGRKWKWLTIICCGVFFLSTSKTAWIFIVVEFVARLIPPAWRSVQKQIRRLRRGSLVVPTPSLGTLVGIVCGLIFFTSAVKLISRVIAVETFVAGSGLAGTATYSLSDRTNQFFKTMDLIREQPWFGRSFGGVSAALVLKAGGDPTSASDLRLNWGYPVIVDVLAASGIIAFLPFLWFFVTNTFGEYKIIRGQWPDERAKWMHALVRALIYECLILIVDQNLMRVYFWFHVTMLVVVGFNLRFAKSKQELTMAALAQ